MSRAVEGCNRGRSSRVPSPPLGTAVRGGSGAGALALAATRLVPLFLGSTPA